MNHYLKILKASAIVLVIMLINAGNAKAQESVITFDIGSFAVTLLSEGQQQGNKSILVGTTEDMLNKTVPDGTFPNAVNAFLVETEDKTILFDAGFGRKLFENLEKTEKKADDIDVVMLTHMHGDHIGGLLRDGKKSFPNATLYIPQSEYDYWMSDKAGNAAGARQVIEAYKDKLQLFLPGNIDDANELLPGIRGVAAYGHTPGHTGYMLDSDGSKLFIWGDLTHAMAIQMPYPEVAVTYDVDAAKAVESRQQLLKFLSEKKIRIAGMHIQFPAIGDVKKNETNGYDFNLICDCEGR